MAASKDFNPPYRIKRFKQFFHRGFLFYAEYNIRLFFFLLRQKRFDIYWSNDLDTLLPNYLISKLFGRPLVYDSHEYFCGVPEIQDRPVVKWIWQSLESWIFPKLNYLITVNQSIAELYHKDYGKRPLVVRNIGNSFVPKPLSRLDLNLPEKAYLVINQGSGINVDRGMEEFMDALKIMEEDVHLLVVGRGDVLPKLKQQAQDAALKNRVHFIGPQPYEKLLEYTMVADLGISLDKDNNINYRYSLPNKVFDYIKCGLPILSSEVVEVKSIVERYDIGLSSSLDAESLKSKLEIIRSKGKSAYQRALKQAAEENNWEEESKLIRELILKIEQE